MRGMGPGNMAPIRIDLHTLVRYWLISPFTCAVLAGLILAGLWYFQATRDLAEAGVWWPGRRTGLFLAGLVAVELAFQSSVAMLPYISFPMAVVQKLFLLVVAPPLLVLGAPLELALATASQKTRDRLLAATRSAAGRAVSHPTVLFFLFYGGLLAFFLTQALAASMRRVWLLDVVNLAFLAVAVLFWSATLAAGSPGRRLPRLWGGAVLASALGVLLLVRTTPVAPIYTLAGTHSGAALLWAGVGLATLGTRWAVYAAWTDYELDPEDELDPVAAEDHPPGPGVRLSGPG
ncbi:MAG TPA: cytochrome c oxidase assembly protein [Acidimicrobiales bacterium]